VLSTIQDAIPGASLKLTIDTKQQKYATKALQWAMKTVGFKFGKWLDTVYMQRSLIGEDQAG